MSAPLTTDEAVAALRTRHATRNGKWANVVEFCLIDFLAVGCWQSTDYALHGYEIKVSRSDWLRELKQPHKAEFGMARCDFWYLAAPPGILQEGELPEGWGYVELARSSTRLKVKPTRLRPKAPRTPYLGGDQGLALNPAFFERESFAMLARRFAYADADRLALLEVGDDETRTAALDKAARRTGRMDSRLREQQREFSRQQSQQRREYRAHEKHRAEGIEYSPDCPLAWCDAVARDVKVVRGFEA